MQTVTNVFITNLALSDILVSRAVSPSMSVENFSRRRCVVWRYRLHRYQHMEAHGIWAEFSATWFRCRWASQVIFDKEKSIFLRLSQVFSYRQPVVRFLFSSLRLDIDLAGYRRRSLFCHCSSIPFAHAFGRLFIIDHCYLGGGHFHFFAISDLHAI